MAWSVRPSDFTHGKIIEKPVRVSEDVPLYDLEVGPNLTKTTLPKARGSLEAMMISKLVARPLK